MKPEILYKLYSKYNKSLILNDGFELLHSFDKDSGKFIFTINNNEKPYSKKSLSSHIEESLYNFFSLLGFERAKTKILSSNYILNCQEMFLTEEFEKQTKDILKFINVLEFNKLKLHVKHVRFEYKIKSTDEDRIILYNYVNPNLTNDELEIFGDKHQAVEEYRIHQRNEPADESDENYLDIDRLLNKYPSLIDYDWMYNMTKTIFIL